MENDEMLTIIDKDGKETKYEILGTFYSDLTKKNYIVYTDNTFSDDNKENVYASVYYPEDDSKLEPLETDEEWKMVEGMLELLREPEDDE